MLSSLTSRTFPEPLEKVVLRWAMHAITGVCFLDPEVFNIFLTAPHDIVPDFEGPPGRDLKGGRGRDHPRYGRFVYALARHYKPEVIVEVGTYAGETAVGWG